MKESLSGDHIHFQTVRILSTFDDVAGKSLLNKIRFASNPHVEKIKSLYKVQEFVLQSAKPLSEEVVQEVLIDPVLQSRIKEPKDYPTFTHAIEVQLLPGMTDNLARTTQEAFQICGAGEVRVKTKSLILLDAPSLNESDLQDLTEKFFYNPYLHSVRVQTTQQYFDLAPATLELQELPKQEGAFQNIAISKLNNEELEVLSKKNLLALNLQEMRVIQDYFKKSNREPTDVEIEVIAQTWSEHCKHKIFAAEIEYTESLSEGGQSFIKREIPNNINSLFKTTISGTTKQLPKPWLLSVFSDNAGIVAFSEDEAVGIKVETHNSPSALDPFGGAITGIVGVNRDILGCGLGAKPIFNTNIFCVGPIDAPAEKLNLPPKIIPPLQILEGVRQGVESGGNQSGIPTVNGALYFDESYRGKPLVFCGSGGILPRKILGRPCEEKKVLEGDLICMVGGRIGRDGIHGATFSSQELEDTVPGSVVQLGDPITQRRVTDFLMEARDLGLYRAVTDNGAGGLSSSVGEMATLAGGATFDVSKAKTKVSGLKAFEFVISESQERMTLAVQPENLEKILELARKRGVEASVLGTFNASGKLKIQYRDQVVCDLDLDFLHHGVPQLKLKAHWDGAYDVDTAKVSKSNKSAKSFQELSPLKVLQELLSRPNIRSKESIIRQYDHEVQARSVVKGLTSTGFDQKKLKNSPNDAAVLELNSKNKIGIVVSCGLQPRHSKIDPYLMAQMSVDEAIRNALAVGAEFPQLKASPQEAVLSLVDNFCWPDPVQDPKKMAALVRTCYGLQEICLAYKIPLISGKDSMKNDYKGKVDGKDIQISVLPTLLMTALGRIQDYEKVRTADFKNQGDLVYLLGRTDSNTSLLASEYSELPSQHQNLSAKPALPDFKMAQKLYSWLGGPSSLGKLKSAHDLSEGGLLVALAESLFARNLGVELNLDSANFLNSSLANFFFGEGFHQFVVSVDPSQSSQLEKEWEEYSIPYLKLGHITQSPIFKMNLTSLQSVTSAELTAELTVEELERSWSQSVRGGVV